MNLFYYNLLLPIWNGKKLLAIFKVPKAEGWKQLFNDRFLPGNFQELLRIPVRKGFLSTFQPVSGKSAARRTSRISRRTTFTSMTIHLFAFDRVAECTKFLLVLKVISPQMLAQKLLEYSQKTFSVESLFSIATSDRFDSFSSYKGIPLKRYFLRISLKLLKKIVFPNSSSNERVSIDFSQKHIASS